ncbi:hypothetical protein B0H13DRAFT_2255634 [Mycena leptocephala]|nr:hypothetical protein B0H13DRAFT_2255634 [Mycena leptocephala]
MAARRTFTAASYPCPEPGCKKLCKTPGGLKQHRDSAHLHLPQQTAPVRVTPAPLNNDDNRPDNRRPSPAASPPPSPGPSPQNSPPPAETIPPNRRGTTTTYHSLLDGTPCDRDGHDLPAGSLPPLWRSALQMTIPLLMLEMAQSRVDRLAQLLAALYPGQDPPFADHTDLYSTIDAIQQGDVPWESFSVQYSGPLPEGEVPEWMTQKYEVWFRSPLGIFEKELVLGSDKTTVSVGTGNTEFYPLYGGVGNLFNGARRAHRDGLSIMAFLSIPKSTRDYANSTAFRKFRRQLFHSTLARILEPLKPHMTVPRVTRCADGHFRRAIYGLRPYIADYPEQVLLTCIVQGWCPRCLSPADDLDRPSGRRSHEHTDALLEACTLKELWDDFGIVGDLIPFTAGFPRADIHELISMDLLHQVIKGTFKDHVVEWVEEYIRGTHEKAEADKILADIDRRIAVTTPFPGLRHFHTGRGYKQWTGNDSKGLTKVYLPAIAGHVPSPFCYLINAAVARFHAHREIFRFTSRPDGFSFPRQHSINFGAPNGSKHIKAVKRPMALSQILLINQRLDKLAAARADFTARGMMDGALLPLPPPPPRNTASLPPENPEDDRVDAGAVEEPTCVGEVKLAKRHVRRVPRDVHQLADYVDQPRLCELIRRFLYDQLNPDAPTPGGRIPLEQCPVYVNERIYTFNSARAVFYAPSDVSGVGGMLHERIFPGPYMLGTPNSIAIALAPHLNSYQSYFNHDHLLPTIIFQPQSYFNHDRISTQLYFNHDRISTTPLATDISIL